MNNINRQLIDAVKSKNLEKVKSLLEEGADIHYEDDAAFQWAIYLTPERQVCEHIEIIKFLIEKGANIFTQHNYALKNSLYKKNFDIVEILIEKGVFPIYEMKIPEKFQDKIIENNLPSMGFITNLRPDLKEKYKEYFDIFNTYGNNIFALKYYRLEHLVKHA